MLNARIAAVVPGEVRLMLTQEAGGRLLLKPLADVALGESGAGGESGRVEPARFGESRPLRRARNTARDRARVPGRSRLWTT